MGKHKKKKDKKEHRSRSKDSKVGKSLKRGHKLSHQHDDKSHKRKGERLIIKVNIINNFFMSFMTYSAQHSISSLAALKIKSLKSDKSRIKSCIN